MPAIKEVWFRGVRVFVNPDDTVGSIILKGEEPEQIELDHIINNVKDDSVIVDVGACYGEYALVCANKARKGIVVAIEPNPLHFELLKRGIEFNNFKNIILINKALSDRVCKMEFYIGNKHLEGSSLFKPNVMGTDREYKTIQIDVTTLDKLLQELNIHRIDILKIDSEGAELKIMKGAENILKNSPDLKMLTEFGTDAISNSGESPIEYLTFLINRFKDVRILRDGKELGDGRDIIDRNNLKYKYKIVCTNLFCQ